MVRKKKKWAKELGYSSGEEVPEWMIDIDKRLKEDRKHALDSSSGRWWRTSWSISRVPDNLSSDQTRAFVPEIVSVGPFYHRDPRLQTMEENKKQYLVRLLKGKSERTCRQQQRGQEVCEAVSLKDLMNAMKLLEDQTRMCYSECFDEIPSDDFVHMMVVDGCFIIELLRLFHKSRRWPEVVEDSIFEASWMLSILCRDLLMLENQLPYFVLEMLFKLTSVGDEQESDSLPRIAVEFFDSLLPRNSDVHKELHEVPGKRKKKELHGEYNHLLDLFHSTFLHSVEDQMQTGRIHAHLIPPRDQFSALAHNAVQMQEAGIRIQRRAGHDILDLAFDKRVLQIPPLSISDNFISVLLNFLAYEQCHNAAKPLFTNYFLFMSSLIQSADDVRILESNEIIKNFYGGRTDVAVDLTSMLSLVSREILHDPDLLYLKDQSKKVNEQCRRYNLRIREKKREYYMRKLHGWYRNLISTYFSSPWTVLSLLAAIALLIMTALQTIYTLRGYYKQT